MKIKKWLEDMNETLLDLIIGCIVYSAVFEVIGLIVVPNRGSYSLGLLIGTAVAVGSAISMAAGISQVLDQDKAAATRNSILYSLLRMIVMFVVAWIGLKSSHISFYGEVIGMIGLKISAHLHVYTNVYITKKIRRKGR